MDCMRLQHEHKAAGRLSMSCRSTGSAQEWGWTNTITSDAHLTLLAQVYTQAHPWEIPQQAIRLQLQALVYDILPSTSAVFSYDIGPRKLLANEQFFGGAQTVISLLQTTQIKQGVSFIAANKVYTSTNKTTIVWIEMELFFFFTRGGCVSCLRACFGARLLLQSY